jgi:hypothetical protein
LISRKYPVTHAVYPTTGNTPQISVQPIVQAAIDQLLERGMLEEDFDVDGSCRFGRYRVHIGPDGAWLEIGDRKWEIAIQDVTRYVADGRRRNSRLMPTAWGRQYQSRQIPVRAGARISVIGANGRKHTAIFKTEAGLGTRTELGIGYDIWRLSNKHRLWKKRRILIAEVCPLASEAAIQEKAESGWWPSDKQRPAGMWRSRFQIIQAALRENEHINGKRVYKGREQWNAKLPPPMSPPPSTVPEPENAAESFFRQVYGERLKL